MMSNFCQQTSLSAFMPISNERLFQWVYIVAKNNMEEGFWQKLKGWEKHVLIYMMRTDIVSAVRHCKQY